MTAHVLISGTLFRSAEERTGKTPGKSFVAATIKVRDGEAAEFWRVLAFSEGARGRRRACGAGRLACRSL